VRRCLEPDPAERFGSAAELAQALEGCRRQRWIETELPPAGPLTRAALHRPILMMVILTLLPHLFGSFVNITYNALWIVSGLTPEQKETFARFVLIYNVLCYPLCLWIMGRLLLKIHRSWSKLQGMVPIRQDEIAELQDRVLRLPLWVVLISSLAWMVGGVVFPLVLHLASGPIPWAVFGHFFISFTISGLIAVTYGFFSTQYVVLRVFCPQLGFHEDEAGDRLQALEFRLRLFQLLAGLIPLMGAILLVVVAPEQFSLVFRLLVAALIGLGMFGLGVAIMVTGLLNQVLTVLMGSARRRYRHGRRGERRPAPAVKE
jgi:hypothetical protein